MKFLILRRITQFAILALFAVGNYYGIKILNGNLSSSIIFDTIPISDPFAVLQIFISGFSLSANAVIGALIIFIFYALIAPRAFCSWVCPINILTDIAFKLRNKFGFKGERMLIISKNLRYFMLVFSLVLSFMIAQPAFETISYIGIVQRGIIFGSASAIGVGVGIIAFDMFVAKRGICGHICPLGAFWALSSKFSLIRVKHNNENCTKCMKCKLVCPEVQVLGLIGKQSGFVTSSECISCGRCIDVCKDDALKFSIRNLRREK
ncbi:MAG: quinol dehydrogenase ferredoxin subunit NapH [Campylobacter sp.]|nr:quinol dehydrogenase ferredoxin subunit NapH [Campylobacter sp.]